MRAFKGMASIIAMFLAAILPISTSFLSAKTEYELGSRISQVSPAEIPLYRMSPADKARETILEFSECVVARSPSSVTKALALPATDPAADKALLNLAMPDCLRYGELRMQPSLMRGGLFNALYRRDFLRIVPPLYGKPIDYKADVSDPDSPKSQSYIALHDFADCVVRADPGDSRTIVLASVASADEMAGYSKISPALGSCVNIGQNIEFSKIVITAILSEAIYRQSSTK
ncbi:hypothetical protein [Sphingomonas abietis]|uniref:Uncharacterized protein n=1 Tax=Sphingomonas abietis TaxID=3012344 RepID=A0ABY7NQP4_9SPHN|nr:hypothetical protein [Sphingomonas abietis]WBO22259.1 hypothetical protein PBT88_19270 [Sphingomonas abietis]